MSGELFADLWEYLAATDKTVVMYGMGNGADKILAACAEKGIVVSDFFASDGFVRGHFFHGKKVLSWSETKEKYGADRLIVLLSFGTSREDVLQTILSVAREAELYAPDVPAFGDGLFDRAFAKAHERELREAYALLCDDESRRIFENVVKFKLTGRIGYLLDAVSDPDTVMRELVEPQRICKAADLGAYNGDTVRELLGFPDSTVRKIWAMEPDARNFRKLKAYAESETRAEVLPFATGAWSESATLYFDGSGNRNASFGTNRSETLASRPVKLIEIAADTLDNVLDGETVDYIKYDVEGSEREAIIGSSATVRATHPTLLVSLYHRNEDIFALPLLIHREFPTYTQFYMRRFSGVPAWDLNLYCKR